jgi:hypothetical protein
MALALNRTGVVFKKCGNGGSCIETASGNGVILVRDTTNRDGGTLGFTAAAWQEFADSLR